MSKDFYDFDPKDFPDPDKVSMQMMSETLAQMFKGFRKEGLSIVEAAALTAAIITSSKPPTEEE